MSLKSKALLALTGSTVYSVLFPSQTAVVAELEGRVEELTEQNTTLQSEKVGVAADFQSTTTLSPSCIVCYGSGVSGEEDPVLGRGPSGV